MTSKCQHTRTQQIGPDRPFFGSVASRADDEWPPAHGNITRTGECTDCGARRDANINQRHVERSAWGPTRAQREEAARQQRLAAEAAQIEQDAKAAKAAHRRVADVYTTGHDDLVVMVRIDIGAGYTDCPLSTIRAAAEQPDNGDGLVPVYRALLRQANAMLNARALAEAQ